MPYLNPWSDTLVPGTTQARDIDDKFRLLSDAIRERMETGLIKVWTDDPVEIQDDLIGLRDGKQLIIPCTAFREQKNSAKPIEQNPHSIAVFRGSAALLVGIHLPPGVTIKFIEWLVDRGDVTSYTWNFKSISFSTGLTLATIATGAAITTAGVHINTSGVLTTTISGNTLYFLDLDTAGSADSQSMFLYGVRITYNTPNSRVTY